MLQAARSGPITLVYGAKDPAHNQAVILQEWLEELLKDAEPTPASS